MVMVLFVFALSLFLFWSMSYSYKLVINNHVFEVDIVDNPILMQKGLSGRKSLAEKEGMLFVFTRLGKHEFWMKDMNFSIDIIWFNEEGKIVHIERSVSPSTYPRVFAPQSDALYVLEINSGLSDKIGLKMGDQFNFVKNNARKLGL